jgi:hypothetical protein
MSWRGRTITTALKVACLALQALAPSLLSLLVLQVTSSIAKADVPRLVPSIATASVVSSGESQSPACRSLECVRQHVNTSVTLRLEGEFGRFTGHVTRWDADSLTAFQVDPDWGGNAPVAPVGWSQISRVDKRVNNSGRGAVIGAITLGAITALLAATAAVEANSSWLGLSSDADHVVNQAALSGALIGGVLGAGIGAGIGSSSHRWVLVYVRR